LSSSSQTNTGITTNQPNKTGLNNVLNRADSASNMSAMAENINSSLSVTSLASNPSTNTNGHAPNAHSQMIPLNDIEFPKLFMY
jgi:hypothetical protein